MAEASDHDVRVKLHADFVAEIHKRELSGSENFDKSILTLASAALAISIGFLKDFVPIRDAIGAWTLYASWILLTLSTCATMASFLVSGRAMAHQKRLAYAYYIERDDSAFTRANAWDQITTWLNYISGAAFVAGLVLSVLFIATNLEKASDMKQQSGPLTKGASVPTLQKVPVAPAPVQQPSATVPAASTPAPAASSKTP